MVASSLQDDLLGIPGVEGAEVDGSLDAPAGLRIRIAEGADQEAVGGAIRRVLSSHGLGTDTQLPGESRDEPRLEPEQSAVAVLTEDDDESLTAGAAPTDEGDQDSGGRAVIDLTDKDPAVPVVGEPDGMDAMDRPADADATGPEEMDDLPPFVEPRRTVETAHDPDQPLPSPAQDVVARIESVAVVEGRTGILVTIGASDGSKASQVASSTEGGVEAAVVRAAANLVDPSSPDPVVVEIEDRRVDGVDIVMIVLDVDGEIVAGSSVVAAGRAFALGRATWAALAL